MYHVKPLTQSPTSSLTHSHNFPVFHALTHPRLHSQTQSLTPSHTHSHTHSCTSSLTLTITNSHSRSHIPSLTSSLTHQWRSKPRNWQGIFRFPLCPCSWTCGDCKQLMTFVRLTAKHKDCLSSSMMFFPVSKSGVEKFITNMHKPLWLFSMLSSLRAIPCHLRSGNMFSV